MLQSPLALMNFINCKRAADYSVVQVNKASADPNLLDELEAPSSQADDGDSLPSSPDATRGVNARLSRLENQIARIVQLQEAMAKQALGRNYPSPPTEGQAGSSSPGITGALLSYLTSSSPAPSSSQAH